MGQIVKVNLKYAMSVFVKSSPEKGQLLTGSLFTWGVNA